MIVESRIKVENYLKIMSKNIVENSNNYNEFQKIMLKFALDFLYEERKKSIILNEEQVRYIDNILNSNIKKY